MVQDMGPACGGSGLQHYWQLSVLQSGGHPDLGVHLQIRKRKHDSDLHITRCMRRGCPAQFERYPRLRAFYPCVPWAA